MLAQMEKDFTDHGYDMDRFWKLKKKTRKYILGRYTACFLRVVPNRHFVEEYHREKCQRQLRGFFKWLKNSPFDLMLRKRSEK